ncbi:MAG: molybdenum cofactor guanylyltransferase [Desulfosalsimonadaceae bacterium]
MNISCSGVILAGGLSSRFQGRNKAFFELNGRRVIDPIVEAFQSIFDDILIVTNTPLAYLDYDVTLVADVFSARSSLTGIHAGLVYSQNPYIFVAACDTPFIQKEIIELVVSRIHPDAAAVMPETPSGTEPLLAAYATSALPVVERHLAQEKFKIKTVFRKMRVIKISKERILAQDPELKSFFNINTAADLDLAGRRGRRPH